MIGLGATVGVAGEAGPGCEAGHGTASGVGGSYPTDIWLLALFEVAAAAGLYLYMHGDGGPCDQACIAESGNEPFDRIERL